MPSKRAKITEGDIEAILVGLRLAQIEQRRCGRRTWPWMRFTRLGKDGIRVTRPDGLSGDWHDSNPEEDDMEEALP